jgi:uncharacterized protein (DUF1778 family)
MPRPRSADPTGQETGCERVTLRLAPSQRQLIRQRATAAGLTEAELLRELVLAGLEEEPAA